MTPNRPLSVALVALYRYQNFPIRTMHAMLDSMDGVQPHTVFFKNCYTNAVNRPMATEERLFIDVIRQLKPALVGFSVYSPYFTVAQRLTRRIKETSTALVVWGGVHPTLFPDDCIAEADAICLGEGEGALKDLVNAMLHGKTIRDIGNLWVNDGGRIERNPLRPLAQQLDAIPFPAYASQSFYFIESGKLQRNDTILEEPVLAVLPARGCPFTCSYCVNSVLRPLYSGLGPYLRRRSVDNVIAEINAALSLPGHHIRMIEFHDENFGTDAAWLDEFTARFPKEVGLPFKVQYHPQLVSPEIIERLVDCGLHRVKFGVEAGTDYIRNTIFHRPGKNSDIVKLVNEISRRKVKIRYDLILDNPYDTEESLEKTLAFMLQLPGPLRFNLYSLQYFPGYPLTRRALSDGHIDAAEADMSTLEMRLARNWAFRPKWFALTRKQKLQNIVWLLAYNRTNASAVRRALEGGLKAHALLAVLSLKAAFWGHFQTIQRRWLAR